MRLPPACNLGIPVPNPTLSDSLADPVRAPRVTGRLGVHTHAGSADRRAPGTADRETARQTAERTRT